MDDKKTDLETKRKPISPKGGGILEGQAGPGRPKGLPNKFTSLRDSFFDVFKMLGGTKGLYEWANKSAKNQTIFYSWITKMLPAGAMIDKTPDAQAIEDALLSIADAMKP